MDALIQQHLLTDAVAFTQLPLILELLRESHFASSGSCSKWVVRLNSLARAKDPLARWTGLCLILKTCQISLHLLLENAATWVALSLPLLVRSEPIPIHKVSISLLIHIISRATHLPEFQRQVSIPNVPKFVAALIALGSKEADIALKCTVLDALRKIVEIYPSTVRTLQTQLYRASSQQLAGGYPSPTSESIVERACDLQSTLHKTAGKAGGPAAWRTLLDATLAVSAACVAILAGSSEREHTLARPTLDLPPIPADPLVAVPLAFNRLKCMTNLLHSLLRVQVTKIVNVPVQNILGHALNCMRLHIDCSPDASPVVFSYAGLDLGCQILSSLALSVGQSLRPHMSGVLAQLTYLLSQVGTPVMARICILRASLHLLNHVDHPFHDEGVASRLLKAVIAPLSKLSPALETQMGHHGEADGPAGRGRGKGKKRTRGYEGEELLKSASSSALLDAMECQEIALLLDVAEKVSQSGFVSSGLHSLFHRMMLSLALSLPSKPPSALSDNLSFHPALRSKVGIICTALCVDTGGNHACGSLGLNTSITPQTSNRALERMIHPKIPPTLRTTAQVENLLLYLAKESESEKVARVSLGLETSIEIEAERRVAQDHHRGNAHANVAIETSRGGPPQLHLAQAVEPQLMEHSADILMTDEGPSAPQIISMPVVSLDSIPQTAPGVVLNPDPTIQDRSAMTLSTPYHPPGWASLPKEVELGKSEPVGVRLEAKAFRAEGSDEGDIPTIDMRSDSEDDP